MKGCSAIIISFLESKFLTAIIEILRKGESECLEALKSLQETIESRMLLIRQIFIWFESTELILRKIKNIPDLIYNELAKVYKKEPQIA